MMLFMWLPVLFVLLNRKAAAGGKINVNIPSGTCLVVHRDGKLLPDLSGGKSIDRLPILVTGNSVDRILSFPKLSSGTGEAQATV